MKYSAVHNAALVGLWKSCSRYAAGALMYEYMYPGETAAAHWREARYCQSRALRMEKWIEESNKEKK